MQYQQPNKPVLSVFDFDGTLTYRDSFTLFLRTEFGIRTYAIGLLRMALPSLKFLLGISSRDELKQRLINTFLCGISADSLAQLAEDFCEKSWPTLMRSKACAGVSEQVNAGATVTLCSASPEIILRPFARRLGVELIATRLEVSNGILTGLIDGQNCRQSEKVSRLISAYGDLKSFHIRAWGDSAGDKQLLEVADEPYYRWFH